MLSFSFVLLSPSFNMLTADQCRVVFLSDIFPKAEDALVLFQVSTGELLFVQTY